jgi:hypothetical protein
LNHDLKKSALTEVGFSSLRGDARFQQLTALTTAES